MNEKTEAEQIRNLETQFICKLAVLISSEECHVGDPIRSTAMIAALSASTGLMVGAMSAYGEKSGGEDVGKQLAKTLMRVVMERVSAGANIGDACAVHFGEKR